jgi:hypothetical protein
MARPNGAKEGLGALGGRERVAHEIRPSEKPGPGDREWEKDAEG